MANEIFFEAFKIESMEKATVLVIETDRAGAQTLIDFIRDALAKPGEGILQLSIAGRIRERRN